MRSNYTYILIKKILMCPTNFKNVDTFGRSNVNYLIFLSRFFSYLGLSPSYENKINKFITTNFQIRCGIILSLSILLGLLSYIPIRAKLYTNFDVTHLTLDIFCVIAGTCVNLLTILEINCWHQTTYLNIFNNLLRIDKKFKHFNLKILRIPLNSYFKSLMVLSMVLCWILGSIYSLYFSPQEKNLREISNDYMLEMLQRGHNIIGVIIIENLMVCVKCQFENVNFLLENINVGNDLLYLNDIRLLQEIYLSIIQQIQNLNKVFGGVLFLIVIDVIITYLHSIGLMMDKKFFEEVLTVDSYPYFILIFLYLVSTFYSVLLILIFPK